MCALFLVIPARLRILFFRLHSSLPYLIANYNPSHKLLTQLRMLTNFLRRLKLTMLHWTFVGASTLKKPYCSLVDFLKSVITLKVLIPPAILIKHSTFSGLVLKLSEKLVVLSSVAFLPKFDFSLQKICVFLFKWHHYTNYSLFQQLSPVILLIIIIHTFKGSFKKVPKKFLLGKIGWIYEYRILINKRLSAY